jgi:hypothetical protein
MKKRIFEGALLVACAFITQTAFVQTSTQAIAPLGAAGLQEEIEWTWEVRPPHADPKLPSVLLVGDSISRNYFPEVQKQLTGVANVYLFASSACAGDPRLQDQIKDFGRMERVRFQVVHVNNGMHGWIYNEADYAAGLNALLSSVHRIAPKATIVWASTTAVKGESQPGPTNVRIDRRNLAALAVARRTGIPVDDQHELMKQHADLYEDDVHFNPAGATIQGDQAAESIRKQLGSNATVHHWAQAAPR